MSEWLAKFFADPWWEALGLTGQLTFGARFVYQWWVSERARKSVVPTFFWWLSVTGSLLIFAYALHKHSLTFTIPTIIGVPIYIRNLILIRREKTRLGGNPSG